MQTFEKIDFILYMMLTEKVFSNKNFDQNVHYFCVMVKKLFEVTPFSYQNVLLSYTKPQIIHRLTF